MKKRAPFIPKEHAAAYDFLVYFENVLVDIPIICTRCGKKMEKEKHIQQFAYNKVRCPRCFHSINTFSYIFDFEGIECVDTSHESNPVSQRNE